MPSGPDTREVHVWFRHTESATADAVEAARATLSPDERRQADQFRFAEDRRDYTLAHDLLRRCLSNYRAIEPSAWDFQRDAFGKPFLRSDSRLSFNLSHTRHLVACVVGAGMPVGIDAERTSRTLDTEALVGRYFSSCEAAALARCSESARSASFLELWTLKEAFLKAIGLGLSLPLDAMSFAFDDGGAIEFQAPPGFDSSEWQFALFEPRRGVRIAVAVRASTTSRFAARELAEDRPELGPGELRPLRRTMLHSNIFES